MRRRPFVIGVHGKCEFVNLDAVRVSEGWQRLLRDVLADEQRQRVAFERRMLMPKMPEQVS